MLFRSEVFLHPKRYFFGNVLIMGWAVRDRRDRNLFTSADLRIRMINGKNSGAGPILAPFDLPSFLFFFSKDDEYEMTRPIASGRVAGSTAASDSCQQSTSRRGQINSRSSMRRAL